MDNPYTAERFKQNQNTKFSVKVDSAEPVDLELVEIAVRTSEPNEQAGMERFSTFFYGPANFFLTQQTYHVTHPKMGELQLFLVAIGRDERGYRYEAVFNVFRDAKD